MVFFRYPNTYTHFFFSAAICSIGMILLYEVWYGTRLVLGIPNESFGGEGGKVQC